MWRSRSAPLQVSAAWNSLSRIVKCSLQGPREGLQKVRAICCDNMVSQRAEANARVPKQAWYIPGISHQSWGSKYLRVFILILLLSLGELEGGACARVTEWDEQGFIPLQRPAASALGFAEK